MSNLDAMSVDELFNYQAIDSRLSRYAYCKRQAKLARKFGFISQAMIHETECDNIYNNLPKELKW